jgi:hypothetical protein
MRAMVLRPISSRTSAATHIASALPQAVDQQNGDDCRAELIE